MATREIAGKTVQVNDEGFMTDPSEWDQNIAAEIARDFDVRRPLPSVIGPLSFSSVLLSSRSRLPVMSHRGKPV